MKLIAASESSKTEWCLVEGIYVIERALTEGLNPYYQTRREISRSIRLQLPEVFFKKKVEHIYYYGAGCTSKEKKNVVNASLVTQFRAPAEVENDQVGAVRSLFGHQPGIACILTTGSTSCFYDGEKIVDTVAPLGYILGGEGSGSVLGKVLLSDCMMQRAPKELIDELFDTYKISDDEIAENVYSKPFADRFLASFTPFLEKHIDNEYVHDLVLQNFRQFFTRNILHYDYKSYPVDFIGDIAYEFADVLMEVASEFEVSVGQIVKSPMAGLVNYHTANCRLD